MQKSDIERLWELEVAKVKRIHQKEISKGDLYITALDYNDEIIILRSKIEALSDTGIIVIANPDRAEKDGEIYQLLDLDCLKLVIFSYDLTEDAIMELLEIEEEIEEEEEPENEYVED